MKILKVENCFRLFGKMKLTFGSFVGIDVMNYAFGQ